MGSQFLPLGLKLSQKLFKEISDWLSNLKCFMLMHLGPGRAVLVKILMITFTCIG